MTNAELESALEVCKTLYPCAPTEMKQTLHDQAHDIRHEMTLRVYGRFVCELCSLSQCTDKHTAAIAVSHNLQQIYSVGINGGPKGGMDCLCLLGGKYTCVHAEANCIAKCTAVDNSKIMICSYSPCVTCASLIVNSGFYAVYYLEKYKDDAGIDILNRAGIKTRQLYLGGDV